LDFAGSFEIVGTASDGLNAVQLASLHKPDSVLLDLSMPRVNGLEAAERIRPTPTFSRTTLPVPISPPAAFTKSRKPQSQPPT
jgi:CheY-like chemotaxis protein